MTVINDLGVVDDERPLHRDVKVLDDDPYTDVPHPAQGAHLAESGGNDDDSPPLPEAVDWMKLWARDAVNEWLVDELWPAMRQLHIFAARKTGKSLIALWIAANLATGRDPFTGEPREPVIVDYLDHEMTEDD